MLTEQEIRKMLTDFIGVQQSSMLARVISIDSDLNTCVVDDDGVEVYDVRLLPIVGENYGIIKIPAVGSYVLCIKIENTDEWKVESASKYDKLLITIGEQKIEITESITINNGDNGGLVISDAIVKKLNAIEDKVNDLISKLKLVKIPLAPSGTYLLSADFGTVQKLTKTKASDIENKKFKH